MITATQLKQVMSEGAKPRILDVRTGGEFDSVHIPGSYNVPLDSLDSHIVQLASSKEPVVVVCQSGARAGKACQRLTASGRTSISVLDGGVQAWQGVGGDVVTGTSDKWALDRQVRFVAGALVVIGILASLIVPELKWLAGAVGFGLFFSAATNTCAMGAMLARLPYNRSGADPREIERSVAALSS